MSSAAGQRAPETRSRRIDTRFNSAELASIERVADRIGLRPSAFVRGAAMAASKEIERRGPDSPANAVMSSTPQLTPEQLAIINNSRVEVKRAGVNLNQLVRGSHRGVLDLGALAPVVEELAKQHERMVDALGGKGQM